MKEQQMSLFCYFNNIQILHYPSMGGDSKSKDSKSKKKADGDKSQKSVKSKSKQKEESKSASKSPAKKQKQTKPKKDASKVSKAKKQDQSDVSSIMPTAPPSADCVHHKSPFIYYCETCEQLICNQCTVYGPHNNHLHKILKITDAYRSRVYYLSQAIRTNLVDKREKTIAQLHRLEYRVQQIRFVKNIIARDIRSQYGGMLERLKNHQGVKLAQLSHEVSLAQREVDNINDIGNTFFDLTSLNGDDKDKKICKFLLKAKKMYQAIEYLLNKPQRPLPEVKVEELPRQIQQSRALLQKSLAAKQINDFKNEVIFNLSKDLKEQQKKIKAEVELKADGMIRGLSQQAQLLNKKMNQYKMACFYCNIRLAPKVVNSLCEVNKLGENFEFKNDKAQKSPPESYNYNGRHFFSKIIDIDEH